MVTSVIELADRIYKRHKIALTGILITTAGEKDNTDAIVDSAATLVLASICCNANDIGLPLSVVEQLLKGTGYEEYL